MNIKRLFFALFFVLSLVLATPVLAIEQQHVVTFGENLNFSMHRIDEATTKIGLTAKASIVLRYGTWNLDENTTIPSNINFQIPPGAVLDGAYTLTINGPFSGGRNIFGSSITIIFGPLSAKEVLPEWFNEDYLSSTRTRACIVASNAAGSSTSMFFGKIPSDPNLTGWGSSESGTRWFNTSTKTWRFWNGTSASNFESFGSMADMDKSFVGIHASASSTIEGADTAAVAVGALLVVSENYILTSDTTIASSSKIIPGGSFTKASTYKLHFSGSFENPSNNQCFIGFDAGDVTGLKESNPLWWGPNTTPLTTDMIIPIKSAIGASLNVKFTDGSYKITDEIILNSNQTITLSAGVTIRQYTAEKSIFKATAKDNVWIHCNGGILYGEGGWSAAWTGNSGHADIAVYFYNCTRSGVTYPTIKNCASAGIKIESGRRIRIIAPTIEGTHEYSTPLTLFDNFQNGILIGDTVADGVADDIVIVAPDISNTCQGVLLGGNVGVPDTAVGVQIIGPIIHDIIGQHAIYLDRGKVTISNPIMENIALSGVKIQSGESNKDIKGFSVTGAVGNNIGASLLHLAVTGTGSISNVILSATGDVIGDYGLIIGGKISNVKADLVVSNSKQAVYLNGDNQQDFDITVTSKTSTETGVYINSTNASGIRIRPTIREPGTSGTTHVGIYVDSASANIELFNPIVTDANSKIRYCLYETGLGSTVKVYGRAIFTGASLQAVRNDLIGSISEWPLETTLQGDAVGGEGYGDFTTNLTLSSTQPMILRAISTSAVNVAIFGRQVPDNSGIFCVAELVGILEGSSERAGYLTTCLAYRHGGNVTIEAQEDTSSLASGSFAGAHTWAEDPSNQLVVLNVNSGGAANYLWKVRVTCTMISE